MCKPISNSLPPNPELFSCKQSSARKGTNSYLSFSQTTAGQFTIKVSLLHQGVLHKTIHFSYIKCKLPISFVNSYASTRQLMSVSWFIPAVQCPPIQRSQIHFPFLYCLQCRNISWFHNTKNQCSRINHFLTLPRESSHQISHQRNLGKKSFQWQQ